MNNFSYFNITQFQSFIKNNDWRIETNFDFVRKRVVKTFSLTNFKIIYYEYFEKDDVIERFVNTTKIEIEFEGFRVYNSSKLLSVLEITKLIPSEFFKIDYEKLTRC